MFLTSTAVVSWTASVGTFAVASRVWLASGTKSLFKFIYISLSLFDFSSFDFLTYLVF